MTREEALKAIDSGSIEEAKEMLTKLGGLIVNAWIEGILDYDPASAQIIYNKESWNLTLTVAPGFITISSDGSVGLFRDNDPEATQQPVGYHQAYLLGISLIDKVANGGLLDT
jgi:hypothetical protein